MPSFALTPSSALSLGLCVLLGAGCVGDLSETQNNDAAPGREISSQTTSPSITSTVGDGDMGVTQGDSGDLLPDMAAPAPLWNKGPWDRYLDPDYNPNSLNQEVLFSGGSESENGAITLGRLRRLEQREMVRSAGRWFPSRRGSTGTAQNPFEVSRPHIGYSTYNEGEGVNRDALAQVINVLPDTTYSWVNPTGKLFFSITKDTKSIKELRATSRLRFAPLSRGVKEDSTYSCMNVARGVQPTRDCVEAFARVYLQKDVLRQPPSAGDVQALTDYMLDAFKSESATMDAEQILEGVANHTRRENSTGRLPQELAGNEAVKCLGPAAGSLAPPTQQCVKDFVEFYLREAVYFRPPSSAELEDLEAMALELHKELPRDAYDVEAKQHFVEVIVSAAWLGAPALFRSEIGTQEPDAKGRVALGPWEVAQAIGFVLARRSPGAPAALISAGGDGRNKQWSVPDPHIGLGYLHAFEQAAEDGKISDRAYLATLIRAAAAGIDEDRRDLPVEFQAWPMRSNRDTYWVAEGIGRFFREWLEVDSFETAFKDTPEATSKYEGNARHIAGSYAHLQSTGEYSSEPMYLEQLDDMIARIVQEDKQVLENLLTSGTFYTPRGVLADGNVSRGQKPQYVYGIEDEHDGSRENRRRTLPADERAGVLTHPAWLGAHSSNFENGTAIIYRGKWVRERLLCGIVPPVTDDIDAALVEGEGKGGRQRVEESTEVAQTNCAGCHSLMNSLGKPFEMYNHAGFLRAFDTRDGQKIAPDGSSTLTAMPSAQSIGALAQGTKVKDALDFVRRAADSDYVKRCFIRQTFRHFMGRSETELDAYTLSQMELSYEMTDGSFIEMLVTLLTSDAFLMRLPLSVLTPKETP